MEIIIIAAMTESGIIGSCNNIPWSIPSEQLFFKFTTLGHSLVMGRKTFESIGRPLPGRRNIVLTSSTVPLHPGIIQAKTLETALSFCPHDKKIFIIGGAEVYRDALKFADSLLLTIIDLHVSGDVVFPPWNRALFTLVGQVTVLEPVRYTINLFHRKI